MDGHRDSDDDGHGNEDGTADDATGLAGASFADVRAELTVAAAAGASTVGLAVFFAYGTRVRAGTAVRLLPLLAYPGYVAARRVGLPGPLAAARTWAAVAVALAVGSAVLVTVGTG
jgi:hypothetical protein